jgi:hypothetical protein
LRGNKHDTSSVKFILAANFGHYIVWDLLAFCDDRQDAAEHLL